VGSRFLGISGILRYFGVILVLFSVFSGILGDFGVFGIFVMFWGWYNIVCGVLI